MKKSILIAVTSIVLGTTGAAFADEHAPGASGVAGAYGETHKGLATSGETGQGPNRGGHVPGKAHGGMTGIAGVGKGAD
jgi:hypothetical protein